MSVRNLAHLFQPRSVAVIGASDRPQSLGITLARDRFSQTRVSRLQTGYRDRAAIDHEALYLALLKVSPGFTVAASDDRQSTNSALDLQPPTAPSTRNPSIAPGRSP